MRAEVHAKAVGGVKEGKPTPPTAGRYGGVATARCVGALDGVGGRRGGDYHHHHHHHRQRRLLLAITLQQSHVKPDEGEAAPFHSIIIIIINIIISRTFPQQHGPHGIRLVRHDSGAPGGVLRCVAFNS